MTRRLALAIGMLMLGLVACTGGNGDGDAEPTTTGPAETAPVTSPSDATRSIPIDGTWSAREITAREARAAIEAQGFGRTEFDEFWSQMGASESFGLTVQFRNGSYRLLGGTDGADPELWDRGSYTVEDDVFTFLPPSGGTTTHRWTIEGGRLEFELLDSTEPDLGLPTEVFAAAFFTSEPFERVGS